MPNHAIGERVQTPHGPGTITKQNAYGWLIHLDTPIILKHMLPEGMDDGARKEQYYTWVKDEDITRIA